MRHFDKQGRCNLPKDLCELAGLADSEKVLLVQEQKEMIQLSKFSELDSITKPIIGVQTLAGNWRLLIPSCFRGNQDNIEVFYLNGHICLR